MHFKTYIAERCVKIRIPSYNSISNKSFTLDQRKIIPTILEKLHCLLNVKSFAEKTS